MIERNKERRHRPNPESAPRNQTPWRYITELLRGSRIVWSQGRFAASGFSNVLVFAAFTIWIFLERG